MGKDEGGKREEEESKRRRQCVVFELEILEFGFLPESCAFEELILDFFHQTICVFAQPFSQYLFFRN